MTTKQEWKDMKETKELKAWIKKRIDMQFRLSTKLRKKGDLQGFIHCQSNSNFSTLVSRKIMEIGKEGGKYS